MVCFQIYQATDTIFHCTSVLGLLHRHGGEVRCDERGVESKEVVGIIDWCAIDASECLIIIATLDMNARSSLIVGGYSSQRLKIADRIASAKKFRHLADSRHVYHHLIATLFNNRLGLLLNNIDFIQLSVYQECIISSLPYGGQATY